MTGKTEISLSELVETEKEQISLRYSKSAGKMKQIKAGTHAKYARGKVLCHVKRKVN